MKTLMVSHLWQLLRVPPAGTPILNRGTVSQGRTGELPGRLTPRLQVAGSEGTTFHLLRVPFPELRLCTLLVFGDRDANWGLPSQRSCIWGWRSARAQRREWGLLCTGRKVGVCKATPLGFYPLSGGAERDFLVQFQTCKVERTSTGGKKKKEGEREMRGKEKEESKRETVQNLRFQLQSVDSGSPGTPQSDSSPLPRALPAAHQPAPCRGTWEAAVARSSHQPGVSPGVSPVAPSLGTRVSLIHLTPARLFYLHSLA